MATRIWSVDTGYASRGWPADGSISRNGWRPTGGARAPPAGPCLIAQLAGANLPIERARNIVEKHLEPRADVQVGACQIEPGAARGRPDFGVDVGQVDSLRVGPGVGDSVGGHVCVCVLSILDTVWRQYIG